MLKIQVVGGGCANCNKLAQLCEELVEEGQFEAVIEKVTDYSRFPDLGIFVTPGLIVNGNILSSGKIPMKSTLSRWLSNARDEAEQ